jgi:hypothetical protein
MKFLENDLLYKKFENSELGEEIRLVQNELNDTAYKMALKVELLKKQKELRAAQFKKSLEALDSDTYSLETKTRRVKNALASLVINRSRAQNAIIEAIEAEQIRVG